MLPKKGKEFPKRDGKGSIALNYARAIATALRAELGDTHQAIKTVMGWTVACERTAKNWLAGTRGPAGEHLILLLRNSDTVLERSCGCLNGKLHRGLSTSSKHGPHFVRCSRSSTTS